MAHDDRVHHMVNNQHLKRRYPDSKVHGANMGPPGSCRPQMGTMLAPWTCYLGRFRELILCYTHWYVWKKRLHSAFVRQPRECHYNDVIMGAITSQITSLTLVHSTIYSGADQSKHRCSASLGFVRGIHRWPVNSPHKGPVPRKMFPFDDVIMVMDMVRKYLCSPFVVIYGMSSPIG